ncbi:uncharacterized protein RCH25_004648 [Pelodytes ibericus]
MQGQEWLQPYGYRKYMKTKKIFWIGSSDIDVFPSLCSKSSLDPVPDKKDRLPSERLIRTVCDEKYQSQITKASKYILKNEKQATFTVCGASFSLQERSKSQEKQPSRAASNMRKGQTAGRVHTGDFQPGYHKNIQHVTRGRFCGVNSGDDIKCSGNATLQGELQHVTHGNKTQTTILHLYLPKVESQEEGQTDTARIVDYAIEDFQSKAGTNKTKPPKRQTQNPTKQSRPKAALTTRTLSLHYGGDCKWVISLPTRIYSLLEKTKKDKYPTNTNCRKNIQRAANNVGYRLGPYYSDETDKNFAHGLTVKSLTNMSCTLEDKM